MNEKVTLDLQGQVSDAQRFLAEGDYAQAEKLLKELLSKDQELSVKDRYHVMTLYADSLFAQKRFDDAERYYKEIIVFVTDAFGSEDPYAIHPLIRMGKICKRDRDFEAAEEFFLVAIGIEEKNPDLVLYDQRLEVYRELASLYIEFHNKPKVTIGYLGILEELLREDLSSEQKREDLGRVLLSKAYCLISLGEVNEASELLKLMLEDEYSESTKAFAQLFNGLGAHVLKREDLIEEYLQGAYERIGSTGEDEKTATILTFLVAHSVGVGQDEQACDYAKQAAKLLHLASEHVKSDKAGIETDHLKGAGFHMVSEVSDLEAQQIRELLYTQAEKFAGQKQYLLAHFLMTYFLRASISIRGEQTQGEQELSRYAEMIPAFTQEVSNAHTQAPPA